MSRRTALLLAATAVLILAVRACGGSHPAPPAMPGPTGSAASRPAAAGPARTGPITDPSPAIGTPTPPPAASPAASTPVVVPAVTGRPGWAAAATAFTAAWIDTTAPAGTWSTRLTPLCTPRLAGALADVDPVDVPAHQVIAAAILLNIDDDVATVRMLTDTGTLTLGLRWHDQWLVDSIDWTPDR